MTSEEQDTFELPRDVEDLTKEKCAKVLRRALARSRVYQTQADLARATGIDGRTLGKYFTAKNRPRQETWTLLRAAFSQDTKRPSSPRSPRKDLDSTREAARRVSAILLLLKHELEFFRSASKDDRRVLAEYVPGPEAGFIAGLLTALYDEDQLAAFETFSQKDVIEE
jgi:hypothetical protein